MVVLQAGSARAEIVPSIGAGLAGVWAGDLPVLRPWSRRAEDGPFALAMNLLAPFSNRISAGFRVDGTHHELAPNLAGEPFPIHGDAFQQAWDVVAQGPDHASLALPHGSFGPFRYAALVNYSLTPSTLRTELRLTSTADGPLPFGAGFHPWFPRDAETRIRFQAQGYWPEDARHLPATETPVPIPAEWRWREPAPLPMGWINAGFADWDGNAVVLQGKDAASVAIRASGLCTALLFSPDASADFFCFEPVSHPVDAHNLPGSPGLVRLDPGESLSVAMTLDWSEAQ